MAVKRRDGKHVGTVNGVENERWHCDCEGRARETPFCASSAVSSGAAVSFGRHDYRRPTGSPDGRACPGGVHLDALFIPKRAHRRAPRGRLRGPVPFCATIAPLRGLGRMHINHVYRLSVIPATVVTMRLWDEPAHRTGELHASQQSGSLHLLLAGQIAPRTCR